MTLKNYVLPRWCLSVTSPLSPQLTTATQLTSVRRRTTACEIQAHEVSLIRNSWKAPSNYFTFIKLKCHLIKDQSYNMKNKNPIVGFLCI